MVAEENPSQRRHIYFSGRVQGVGFRFTVRWIASECRVVGFVRNLPDGRVELVAEGPPDELQRLVDAIDERLGRHIFGKQETVGPAAGRFHAFEIRY